VKAVLKLHEKRIYKNSMVLELKLWEVEKTKKYPDGIKYRLIMIDPKTRYRILMDNHSPKGHHFHVNNEQFDYDFTNIPKLLSKFKELVQKNFGVSL
jgi:hypothetical protein